MILFNPNQFQDLKNLIRKDILQFISDNVGKKYLLDNDKDFLKSQGVDVSKLSEAENTVFNLAFKFGMYSNNTNFHKSKNLSLNDFEKIVKSNKFMPLTAKEESALDSITYEGVRDIRNLSDRIGAKVEIKLSAVEKKRKIELETIVHDATKRAILKRETVKEFASELLHITGDTSRDWLRVAQFNLHSTHNAGIATEMQRLYGNDALCYKHVYAGSCKYCEDKYFENGFGSKPKIYKLSELVANGTNIGVAKKDWKPVVGSEHPYCRCTLVDLPPHYQYDEKINKFAPVYDTEGAMKRIRAFEQKLREAKGKRGEWEILKKSLYSDLALNKVKEHKETAKIPSYYKVVNEYENKFNMAFAKMLGQTMENLIKIL